MIIQFFKIIFAIFILSKVEAAIKPKFLDNFLSEENKYVSFEKWQSIKIKGAIDRLVYCRFELKIQLELLGEFRQISNGLNEVFGDKMMQNFDEINFFRNAAKILDREIEAMLKSTYFDYLFYERKNRFEELLFLPRKYFPIKGNYPVQEGLIRLDEFVEMINRELLEPIDIGALGRCFSSLSLDAVLKELREIFDAEDSRLPRNARPSNNNEAQNDAAKKYYEMEGRIRLKEFIGYILTEKEQIIPKNDQMKFFDRERIAFVERKLEASKWARLHFEVFFMRLNAILMLLEGIGKFMQNEHPAQGNRPFPRKKPIQIMEKENQKTMEYLEMGEKLSRMGLDGLELVNQFMANLKVEKDGEIGKNNDENQKHKADEVLKLIRDHLHMGWWDAPKKKANWTGLDAGDLGAFEDYVGKKFDRENWAMVLHRQMMTEVGALKIVQEYVEQRKGMVAKYLQGNASTSGA